MDIVPENVEDGLLITGTGPDHVATKWILVKHPNKLQLRVSKMCFKNKQLKS